MLAGYPILLLAVQQVSPVNLASPAVSGTGIGEVAKVCDIRSGTTADQLLKREYQVSWAVTSRRPKPATWTELGCVRAMLSARDVISKEGPGMPLGAPWSAGAVYAAVRALQLDRRNERAAVILSLLSLRLPPGTVSDSTLSALRGIIALGSPRPEVLRACSELMTEAHLDSLALSCTERGRKLGRDLTWHNLRAARIDFRAGQPEAGAERFSEALANARDSAAVAEVLWHLQWFLSPEELAAFQALPVDQLAPWVQIRLAARDVRDGRPLGSRLAAHFSRLEFVLEHFRLRLPAMIAKRGGLVGSTPDNDRDPWEVLSADEPGAVPAFPYRYYARWQAQIDDRGVVYMRYGEPDVRLVESPYDTVNGHPEFNWRELWRYEIDGRVLLLNFEGERFDGSVEATRLVTGVLGSYMCDVDVERCAMTERSKMAKRIGGSLGKETIERIRTEDQAAIVSATTHDDNSVRGGTAWPVRAALFRLWDPAEGRPIAIIPVAVEAKKAPDASIHVTQLDASTGVMRDTTIASVLRPASGVMHQAVLVLPASMALTTWSVIVTGPDGRSGRGWEDGMSPIGSGPLVISDLVFGADRSSLQWNAAGTEVALSLSPLDRTQAVRLYYQLLSQRARPGAETTLSVVPVDKGTPANTEGLRIRFASPVTRGLNEVQRELDVSRLRGRNFRVTVTTTDPGTGATASRTARLELK